MTVPARPTLPELRERIQADYDYHLPGASARAPESMLNTLAEAEAGAFHGLYGYAEYLAKQLLPDTADLQWLARWAIMLEVPRSPATYATGSAQTVGAGVIGEGKILVEPKTSTEYLTTTAVYGQNPVIQIKALNPGIAGNLPGGTTLQARNPISGIQPDITVISLSGGADQETVDSWRKRVSKKLAERSKIGDKDDYSLWAISSHAGITGAWVFPGEMGIGTIVIRCIGPSPNIIPDNTVFAEAQAEIDSLRNAGATVFLIAATPKTINIQLSGISDEDTKAAIMRGLKQLFVVKQQQSALLRESEIDAVIQRHTIDYTLISPVTDTQCTDKEVLILGDVEWLS